MSAFFTLTFFPVHIHIFECIVPTTLTRPLSLMDLTKDRAKLLHKNIIKKLYTNNYPVMLNLLIIVPTVIIFILEMSVYIFFSCDCSRKTVLMFASFLFFVVHFFLLFAEVAALAIAAFVFLTLVLCYCVRELYKGKLPF